MLISILIPTMNRSDFLIRALLYYSKIGFKGYICIGDSSNAQHVEKTKRAIQTLGNKIKIIYRNFPNPPYIHDGMVTKELIELAPTPYAVATGDDDFLIPNGLEQCIIFLEDHPEYSATHGIRVAVRLKLSGISGELESAHFAPQPILEHETAVERWIGYMRRAFSTQYSVHRIETWRRMYRDVASIPIRYFGPELLPCSLSSIFGKIKGLDCLSVVFQKNENRYLNWDKQSMYNLITQKDWFASFKIMRDCIIEELIRQDDIDKKKAQEIFNRELWHHILSKLQQQYRNKYHEYNNWYVVKESLKRLPGLVALSHLVWKRTSEPSLDCKYKNRISLDYLLNRSSPFYDDFIAVYQHILYPPELNSQMR